MEGLGTILIIFFVILILLGFRKSISLLLIKWIFGEYSKKYVLKFKKLTRRKPHPYCFKDDFYYHILSIPKAINNNIQYKVDKGFDFDHLDFNKTFKENLKENGRPDCYTISDESGVDLSVVGYKSRMFHSNEKTLLYHCKGQYFMGEYVFTSLADDSSSLLIEMLKKEYHPDIEHAKNFSISDPLGNYLFFTDTGFFLSLKFFNKNHPFVQKTMDKFGDDGEYKIPLEGLGLAICN
jgi:hypothetical protein